MTAKKGRKGRGGKGKGRGGKGSEKAASGGKAGAAPSGGGAALPENLTAEAQERELAEAVSRLRESREAELAALKGRRVTSPLLEQLRNNGSSGSVENSQSRLSEVSRVVGGKANVVSSMKTALKLEEQKEGGQNVVADLDDFYKKQRTETVKNMQEKGRAAEILHGYRGDGTTSVPPNRGTSNGGALPSGDRNAEVPGSSRHYADASKAAGSLNFKDVDYRAFLFVVHEDFGMLLLHCTRKRKKGPHFQLPGGHIDDGEFVAAARQSFHYAHEQLLYAAKLGAARELYEETGLDVRGNLDRLQPAPLGSSPLSCEHKDRLFFFLYVDDHDFILKTDSSGDVPSGMVSPLSNIGSYLLLRLSHEHSGFTFEKDMKRSAQLLTKHSGGTCSEALLMAIDKSERRECSRGQVFGNDDQDASLANSEQTENDRSVVKETSEKVSRLSSKWESIADGCDSTAGERSRQNPIKQHVSKEAVMSKTQTKVHTSKDFTTTRSDRGVASPSPAAIPKTQDGTEKSSALREAASSKQSATAHNAQSLGASMDRGVNIPTNHKNEDEDDDFLNEERKALFCCCLRKKRVATVVNEQTPLVQK